MNDKMSKGLVSMALGVAVLAGVGVGLQAARSQSTDAAGGAAGTDAAGTDAAPAPEAAETAETGPAPVDERAKLLDERAKDLDEREQGLKRREATLKTERERVADVQRKAGALAMKAEDRCRKCATGKKGTGDGLEIKDPQRVALIIKKMKARDAAKIMAEWAEALSVDTLWRLSPRITSPILSKMEPVLAARLLARMRRDTAGGPSLLLPPVRPTPAEANP